MIKFNRNYLLEAQGKDKIFTQIRPPFTVEFDIIKSTLSNASESKFKIYNLSQSKRDNIRKNVWDQGDSRVLRFSAGYGENFPAIFIGQTYRCWSQRQGVNFITDISGFDLGLSFEAYAETKYAPGDTHSKTAQTILKTIPNVKIGAISPSLSEKVATKGGSYLGRPVDILRDFTGNGLFIDNGIANILLNNECLRGDIEEINSGSGLLGTPLLEDTNLFFDILFEPRIKIGQRIKLNTQTGPQDINQFYKVHTVKHRGVISETVSGECMTTIGVFATLGSLIVVPEQNQGFL